MFQSFFFSLLLIGIFLLQRKKQRGSLFSANRKMLWQKVKKSLNELKIASFLPDEILEEEFLRVGNCSIHFPKNAHFVEISIDLPKNFSPHIVISRRKKYWSAEQLPDIGREWRMFDEEFDKEIFAWGPDTELLALLTPRIRRYLLSNIKRNNWFIASGKITFRRSTYFLRSSHLNRDLQELLHLIEFLGEHLKKPVQYHLYRNIRAEQSPQMKVENVLLLLRHFRASLEAEMALADLTIHPDPEMNILATIFLGDKGRNILREAITLVSLPVRIRVIAVEASFLPLDRPSIESLLQMILEFSSSKNQARVILRSLDLYRRLIAKIASIRDTDLRNLFWLYVEKIPFHHFVDCLQLFEIIETPISCENIIAFLKHDALPVRLFAIDLLRFRGGQKALQALSSQLGIFLRASIRKNTLLAIKDIGERLNVESNHLSVARMNAK